jgi:hypothetical protein
MQMRGGRVAQPLKNVYKRFHSLRYEASLYATIERLKHTDRTPQSAHVVGKSRDTWLVVHGEVVLRHWPAPKNATLICHPSGRSVTGAT